MSDGFNRLRHDAVIGSHHQHHNVSHLGTAGAHGGEGFMARRVDEGDKARFGGHLISTDMLGDAAGFT